MTTKMLKRVTINLGIGSESKQIVFDENDIDGGTITVENGYDDIISGLYTNKEDNGQRRVIIKLWKGMNDFDDLRQG